MKAQDLLQLLEHNQRLDAPERCPQPVYDVMLKCWSWNAEDRPNFSDISTFLRDVFQQMQQEAQTLFPLKPTPPPRSPRPTK